MKSLVICMLFPWTRISVIMISLYTNTKDSNSQKTKVYRLSPLGLTIVNDNELLKQETST